VKAVLLGSGTSTGVPRIGNDWGLCDPGEPRNRRTRVSLLIESDAGSRVLIDTSTDLRQQLLANEIDSIDAVFWTHDHADHAHGIDDLRPLRYGRGGAIPDVHRVRGRALPDAARSGPEHRFSLQR
jgi:phosphoribosyl 1,2-cyclic phosphate phosphodiesterase